MGCEANHFGSPHEPTSKQGDSGCIAPTLNPAPDIPKGNGIHTQLLSHAHGESMQLRGVQLSISSSILHEELVDLLFLEPV